MWWTYNECIINLLKSKCYQNCFPQTRVNEYYILISIDIYDFPCESIWLIDWLCYIWSNNFQYWIFYSILSLHMNKWGSALKPASLWVSCFSVTSSNFSSSILVPEAGRGKQCPPCRVLQDRAGFHMHPDGQEAPIKMF